MAFIKYMTICDDNLLNDSRKLLKQYDISAYPPVYFADNKPMIDNINADSEKFYHDLKSGNVTKMPTVPADLFEYEFQQTYDNGYHGLMIVFPHCKWTDFRHQAEIAKKRFLRKNDIDEQGFVIKFFDSKTFGGGTIAQTVELAKSYKYSHLPIELFLEFYKNEKHDKITYILSNDTNVFDSDCGLKAYIIKNNSVRRMNISQYSDSVIFDLFAENFSENCKNSKYYVSTGSDCEFAANVIGRIKKLTLTAPESIVKYGVSSTQLFGKGSLCIYFSK